MNKVLAFLANNWGKILLAIILLVVVIALLRNAPRWLAALKRLTMKDGGDYTEGFQSGVGGNDELRKRVLDGMAQEVYTQITAGITNPIAREQSMEALLDLNDTELRYVAQKYKLLSRDESLYEAVNGELMWASNVDNRLQARLSNIAQV